jgi:two-component system, OmpR family, KDP operon response regulator KdpE
MSKAKMSSGPERVLVISKEAAVRSQLRRTLEALKFDVGEAPNSEIAVTRLRMVDYDAILLECRTFGKDCIAVCKELRSRYPRLPIMVIGVSNALDDKVAAFEAGADDYTVQPFAERELAARIRSAIRRFHAPAIGIGERFVVGDIVLDPDRHRVEKSGIEVSLTPTEFRALKMLMEQPGIPISYSALVAKLRGPESESNRKQLRVVISSLRRKLENDPSEPKYLITHAYIGYCFRGH